MKSYTITIKEVIPAARRAVNLVVERPKGFTFIAGQHVMLALPDSKAFKPFSLSSSPLDEDLSITIKQAGAVTEQLQKEKSGDHLQMKGPFSTHLNFDESITEDVVFLAGGSGICPFMSCLNYAVDKHLPNQFFLFNSNRTEEDFIYKKELDALSKQENITIVNTITREATDDWKGERGRINKDLILKYVAEPEKKVWVLCGTSEMVKHLKQVLLDMNIPKEHIR